MRKLIKQARLLLCLLPFLTGCVVEESFVDDPQGNFDQLWKIIDEQYCFLDYKNIDWDAIHAQYQKRISRNMTSEGLFQVLSEMLCELKDGHVNLASAHNVSIYDEWYQSRPRNFNQAIQEDRYLGGAGQHRTAAGIKYKILSDNIGYCYYESFADPIGNGNLDEILSYLSVCNGLIIDVRNNGGGNISNSTRIASHFTNERVLTGYLRHKSGKGHSDFSSPVPIYLEPANGIRWQKQVVVLTNRRCYSATNDFVNAMRHLPNVVTLGDTTGGGSGLPFTSELPNGWSVRFSASPHFDARMNHIEQGIEPMIKVDMLEEDELKGKDTLIEKARQYLNGKWVPTTIH